jgi:dephospho-CoA kinase
MLKVAITGGIGSGKSTVTSMFKDLEVPVVDVDGIVKSLWSSADFCDDVLKIVPHARAPFNLIDKSVIRETMFNDYRIKQQIENVTHPLIFQEINKQLSNIDDDFCIIDIPLLFETKSEYMFDYIITLACPKDVRIARVVKRNQLAIELIEKIIATQATQSYAVKHSDCIIDSNCSRESMVIRVNELYGFLQNHAQSCI